jgi:hypothetical protein
MKLLERLKGRHGQFGAEHMRDVYAVVAKPALKAMCVIANADSLEEIKAIQQTLPFIDINEMSEADLLKFRRQLQAVWDWDHPQQPAEDKKTFDKIVHEWLSRYPLTDRKRWDVSLEKGFFFPTQMNFIGLMARILYDNRHRLKKCVNCERRFIARRYDSKYCAEPQCRRFYNNERQAKAQGVKQASKKQQPKGSQRGQHEN